MHILTLFYKYPLYPNGSYFQEFLNKLADSVGRVSLVASRYPKGGFAKSKNLRIFWVPLVNLPYVGEVFFTFFALLRVVFTSQLHKVGVVNTVGPRGLLAGWYLKKHYKIPLVCTIELLNPKGGFAQNLYYSLIKFLVTKAPVDHFICWSQYYWENFLKEWDIPQSKVTIITIGIDTGLYNSNVDGSAVKQKYSPNNPLIVFAKPLYDYNTKSVKVVVRAIAKLAPELKVNLLVGGGDGSGEVAGLANDLGVSSQVFFMPPTPFTEIPKFIAAADLIVLPYINAPTTSRSLVEAMALGKPIITAPVGEVGRILESGEDAVLVDSNFKDVANAIQLVLDNPEMAESLGKNSLGLVQTKFALPKIVDQTKEVFSSL